MWRVLLLSNYFILEYFEFVFIILVLWHKFADDYFFFSDSKLWSLQALPLPLQQLVCCAKNRLIRVFSFPSGATGCDRPTDLSL